MTAEAVQSVLEGATVRVSHVRLVAGHEASGWLWNMHDIKTAGLRPSPRGGITTVMVTLASGREVVGLAHCSPRDNFCKAIGRQIALGRAVKVALSL